MMDPKMMMQGGGGMGGGMGGAGGMPMQGGGGGMGGGGGIEQLLQMAMPLLDQMGPQSKMALGAALQTPGVQQLVQQALQNPQMLQQIFAMATQGIGGGGGGMPPGMTGQGQGGFSSPTTDGALYDAQAANQGVRGNLPVMPDTGGYTGYGEEMDARPMSTEEELMMIQQMMGQQSDMPMSTGKKPKSKSKSDDDGDE